MIQTLLCYNKSRKPKGYIMGLTEIVSEALLLKPQERYMIIENLVQSLKQPDAEIDALWVEESVKRLEAIKEGTLKTIPYGDVFNS